MGNPNFDQVSISRDLKTKAKIDKLARLLTVRAKGERISIAQAVDVAVTNELKRTQTKKGQAMIEHEPNEPAFEGDKYTPRVPDMTMRDYFASQAPAGMSGLSPLDHEYAAAESIKRYQWADAMFAERSKDKP